jgi:predicted DCC family thiol-disulfide oxidoreductase YuxK
MGEAFERLTSLPPAVVLFDGVCNLCNRWVNFIIDHDARAYFSFAPLQSGVAKPILTQCNLPNDFLAGIVLWESGRCFTGSTAALRILRRLSGLWWLLYGFVIVPRPVRDAVYDWLIQHRYQWFGKADACRIPTPDIQDRFLRSPGPRVGGVH